MNMRAKTSAATKLFRFPGASQQAADSFQIYGHILLVQDQYHDHVRHDSESNERQDVHPGPQRPYCSSHDKRCAADLEDIAEDPDVLDSPIHATVHQVHQDHAQESRRGTAARSRSRCQAR